MPAAFQLPPATPLPPVFRARVGGCLRMPSWRLLATILLAAAALPASAQVDCSVARDPARCEANQAAIAACADQRGKQKTACLEQHLPPVDCSRAENPTRCEAAEKAKRRCAGKSGAALKACTGQGKAKAKSKNKAQAKTPGKPKASATGKRPAHAKPPAKAQSSAAAATEPGNAAR